jgi:hypothetical protein
MIDGICERGRRSLFVGTLAALGAWLTRGPAPRAAAADGNPALLGRRNEESSPTRVVNTTRSSTALRGEASGPSAIGLEGVSRAGHGVHGLSRDGNGVSGESVFGVGVSGHSIEPGSTAVLGVSTDGVGVDGGSHGGVGVQGNSKFGVAVRGGNISETEPAIEGWAQNGQTGVMGRSTTFDEFDPVTSPRHVGVFGVSDRPGGRGVFARSREGRALQASGRVRFSTSGVATVLAGASTVTVTPTFRVVSSAKVLATPQADPGNGAAVRFVSIDPAANAFTVHLTRPVADAMSVAWFVLD